MEKEDSPSCCTPSKASKRSVNLSWGMLLVDSAPSGSPSTRGSGSATRSTRGAAVGGGRRCPAWRRRTRGGRATPGARRAPGTGAGARTPATGRSRCAAAAGNRRRGRSRRRSWMATRQAEPAADNLERSWAGLGEAFAGRPAGVGLIFEPSKFAAHLPNGEIGISFENLHWRYSNKSYIC